MMRRTDQRARAWHRKGTVLRLRAAAAVVAVGALLVATGVPASGLTAPETSDPTPSTSTTGPASPEQSASSTSPATSPAPESSSSPTPPSSARAAAATAGPALTCEPGYVYSVASNGTVRQVTSDGTITQIGQWPGVSSVNGLAIGANGSVAYAYERSGNSNINRILRYTPVTGAWESMDSAHTTGLDIGLIAGAVDLKTDDYLYGGFETVQRGVLHYEQRFVLWRYTPATKTRTTVGSFWTGVTGTSATRVELGNGDMAFDAQGNLYVVRASHPDTRGNSDVRIYSVTGSALANPRNGVLSASQTAQMTSTVGAVNGVAFDTDGTIYLGTGTTVTRYDPTDGWRNLGASTSRLSSSTDLASCNSPASVTIYKNVVSRAHDNDQFTLSLMRGATEVGTATTTGSETDLQEEKVGPAPARAGQTYTFTETGASGADLADYETSWECAAGGATLASGDGTSGSVTVPPAASGKPGAEVICTITNTAIPDTDLTLVKKVDSSYAPDGATGTSPDDWELTATGHGDTETLNSGDTIEVTAGDYVIGETEQDGFELTEIVCETDGTKTTLPLTGAGARTITIEARTSTTCTLTNEDLPGTVVWDKIDGTTTQHLGGSAWTLTGPSGFNEVVEDNTGLDTDGRPGRFAVDELAWGEYTLAEHTAPEGYLATDETHTLTVSAGALTPAGIEIPNERELILGLEKYGYPQTGQSEPSLLDGSSFAIHADADGEPGAEVEGSVSAAGTAGVFQIEGLRPGAYWLTETTAPSGHSLLAHPVKFTVVLDADHPTGGVVVDEETSGGLVESAPEGLTLRVFDERAVELPNAGGSGAGTLYAAAGLGILLLAGAWALLQRRRQSHDRP